MEYTKDMIFKVRYDQVNNVIRLKNTKWTSSFCKKLIKHKLITISVFIATIFIAIDSILIMNFVKILEKL